jgi:non-homologous end joining protein Ku
MPKAKPSQRALNKDVTLSFGFVNIPVNIFGGTDSNHGIERHQYLPVKTGTQKVTKDDGTEVEVDVFEDHPVGRGEIDKTTGELLDYSQKAQVVKKIETEYGPVYVEDHEIEKLFTLEPDTLKITTFQPQHLFTQGNYPPKTVMQVEPTKMTTGKSKGSYNAANLKAYATLLKAMREEGVVAVGELTTRGTPKPVVLTPDGLLWQVWHTDAVREQRELPEVDLVDAEVKMLGQFIQTMKSTEILDLSDTRSELIQNFANEKAEAGDFSKTADTYTGPKAAEADSNFLAMLQASIDAAKAS